MFSYSFLAAPWENLSARGQATEWGQKKHRFLAGRSVKGAVAMARKKPENENYFQFTFQAEGFADCPVAGWWRGGGGYFGHHGLWPGLM